MKRLRIDNVVAPLHPTLSINLTAADCSGVGALVKRALFCEEGCWCRASEKARNDIGAWTRIGVSEEGTEWCSASEELGDESEG